MNMNKVLDFTKNSSKLAQMMLVTKASMDLWAAENAASHARGRYHESIHRYEEQHGPLVGMLSAKSKAHAAVRKFTAKTYEAYQDSKREVYNAKRRLDNACRKLAFPSL
jgi:hypothetical protein